MLEIDVCNLGNILGGAAATRTVHVFLPTKLIIKSNDLIKVMHFKGAGGVPWGQIMENEFEYLVDRGGHGGHLAEKFLKKYCS